MTAEHSKINLSGNQLTLASPNLWTNELSLLLSYSCPWLDQLCSHAWVVLRCSQNHLLRLQCWNHKCLFSVCPINLKVLIKTKTMLCIYFS